MRKQFGQRLRAARQAVGYETARDFAVALDIEESALSNYERGIRRPPNDVLQRIRDRTKVTADYLYFGDISGLPLGLYAKLREIPGHDQLEERH